MLNDTKIAKEMVSLCQGGSESSDSMHNICVRVDDIKEYYCVIYHGCFQQHVFFFRLDFDCAHAAVAFILQLVYNRLKCVVTAGPFFDSKQSQLYIRTAEKLFDSRQFCAA